MWRLNGVFRVKGTSPTAGKFTKMGCPGKWSVFTGSFVSFFPGEGGLGQNAVSLGQPFTPQQLFAFTTASGRHAGHPELWGLRTCFSNLFVLYPIPLV